MSYTEIGDSVISDGSVVTETTPSEPQSTSAETPYYQQYQEQPESYGETPLPDYQYQTKRSSVNDYYEIGFFTKIFGFIAFATLCVGLIIWLSGLSALGGHVGWLRLLGTVLPMCLGLVIIFDRIPEAYNAILVVILFSLVTGLVAFFDMISFAKSADDNSKTRTVAAGDFFVFLGHALFVLSSVFSFLGK